MATRRQTMSRCLTAALALLDPRPSQSIAAPAVQPPEVFVSALAVQVLAALRDDAVGEAQRLERVDRITAGAFDLARTARIALGRHWQSATPAEREEFAELFKAYVLASYGRRFRGFADRTLRVEGHVAAAGGDMVVASLVEGGATPVRLDWRLTPDGAGWRILDLVVEGVSLLVTFRNEFAAVIERSGGRVAGLLVDLRARVATERAQLAG
jgi:phospholipid transport system substrate-binding protein